MYNYHGFVFAFTLLIFSLRVCFFSFFFNALHEASLEKCLTLAFSLQRFSGKDA